MSMSIWSAIILGVAIFAAARYIENGMVQIGNAIVDLAMALKK